MSNNKYKVTSSLKRNPVEVYAPSFDRVLDRFSSTQQVREETKRGFHKGKPFRTFSCRDNFGYFTVTVTLIEEGE